MCKFKFVSLHIVILGFLSSALLNGSSDAVLKRDSEINGHDCLSNVTNIDIQNEQFEFSATDMCLQDKLDNDTEDFTGVQQCSDDDHEFSFYSPSETIKQRCFCDSICHDYHDCCIDRADDEDLRNIDRWQCRYLMPEYPYIKIYVKQQCPVNYAKENVRRLCEKEPLELQRLGEYFNYLQYIPVHSMNTGIMYRNAYCALCNSDVKLTQWEVYVHCTGHNDTNWQEHSPDISILQNGTYYPEKNKWIVYMGSKFESCNFVIKEFYDWENMVKQYHARLCREIISDCPRNTSITTIQKCKKYSSYVYEIHPFARLRAVYKNFHCAVCNDAPPSNISCYDPTQYIPFSKPDVNKAWLPIIIDFNFIDSNHVSLSVPCDPSQNQSFDHSLLICLNTTCGKLFRNEGGKCVRINGTINPAEPVLQSDCRKVILTQVMFTFVDESSVYVNHTNRIYSYGEYEVHKKNSEGVVEILICEDDHAFAIPPAQIWLSEITLGISIALLIIHILIYILLPKIRNRPGKILMSLALSLVCGHFFLLIGPYSVNVFWLCYIVALLTYIGYISSLFWMNVMAFDVYRTFSETRVRSSSSERTFSRYLMYVWVSTGLIVTLSLLMDNVVEDNVFKPRFARGVCWFASKKSLFVFFGLPITILLFSNIVLFIITAINIRKVSKQTKMVNKSSEKIRFLLYVKLAVVLGLTWTFGFLAASLRVQSLWYPFIVFNGLQGALIFLSFSVKKKIGHMLAVKFRLHSRKYKMSKDKETKKPFYSSLSNLTTLQTTLTSSVAPASAGCSSILHAVQRVRVDEDRLK